MEVTFSSSQIHLNWGLETMSVSMRLRKEKLSVEAE